MFQWHANTSILLLLLISAVTAQSQEPFDWQTNNGTIAITSYRLGEARVAVPETITGLPVTHIRERAFYRNNNVMEVTLPSGLLEIGYCAFQYCGGLTNINFPAGLTNIDNSAFDGTALQAVSLPASLRTCGETPFFQCAQLQAINMDPANANFSSVNGVLFSKDQTRLLEYPAGRSGEYQVPASVYEIVDRAFQNAQGLTKVQIPGQTKFVGYYAFNGCRQLTEVTLEEGITHLGDQAFGECSRLGGIVLPTSLQSVGTLCFSGCTNLHQISLPQGLTTIGGLWVFNGCIGLTNVTIPGTIENASYGTFAGCTNLQSATIQEGVKKLESIFQDCSRLTTVSLPQSLRYVGDNTFNGCRSLIDLVLPNGVTNIGWYAFSHCTALHSPALPGDLLTMGRGAFIGCESVQRMTLPGKVREVGDWCFENCSSLSTVEIPASVVSLGAETFLNCPGLQALNVAPGNLSYCSLDGVLFNADKTVLLQYATGRAGSYSVPPGVRRIDSNAFRGARALTGLTLPLGLEQIRDNAFTDCTGLTHIRMPATVTEVADYAFAYCTNLAGILFDGNAPDMSWAAVYQSPEAGIYFSAGSTGWEPPPAGLTATLWNANLSTQPGSYGRTAEGFKITAIGNANIPVGFQACTNLARPNWTALATGRLINGNASLVDPIPANAAARYYRVAWP